MDPVDIFFKFLEVLKDKPISGVGMVPVALGAALLGIALFMKAGKYHLDKAATLSQIGATALSQLQANQRLTQEELAATRVALAAAQQQIADLSAKFSVALSAQAEAEKMLADADGLLRETRAKLAAAEKVLSETESKLSGVEEALAELRAERGRRRPKSERFGEE